MKKSSFFILINFIFLICCSKYVYAEFNIQNKQNKNVSAQEIQNSKKKSIYIQANKIEVFPEKVLLLDNVLVKYGNDILTSDQAYIFKKKIDNSKYDFLQLIVANGHVVYFFNDIILKGTKAIFDLNTKDVDIYNGSYQVKGKKGLGEASIIQKRDNRYIILKNGSFTFCPSYNKVWNITGSKIIYDRKKQTIKVKNALLRIKKIFVFYSPYLRLPANLKQKKSGFLHPKIQYSNRNGLELWIPYYFNLSKNYDLTIYSHYMTKNSINFLTKLRYSFSFGQGTSEFYWMPYDKFYKRNILEKNNKYYWMINMHHCAVLWKKYIVDINYTKISDLNYFNNYLLKNTDIKDNYLIQNFSINYSNTNLDLSLKYKKFQKLNIPKNNFYYTFPQFDLIYYQNNSNIFNFKTLLQIANFKSIKPNEPESVRIHIEPTLNTFLFGRCGIINVKAKLFMTHYLQDNIKFFNSNIDKKYELKRSVTRIIPYLKIDGKTIFERKINSFNGFIQTIEPRLQYLYIPYHNQDNIGIYGSNIISINSNSLFYEQIYNNIDRIDPFNQLKSSVTMRIYNDQKIEKFNISIGQIYNFSKKNVCRNYMYNTYQNSFAPKIIFVGNSKININNKFSIKSNIQYDFNNKNFLFSKILIKYKYDEDRIWKLHCRYINSKFLRRIQLQENSNERQTKDITDIEIAGSIPITKNISFVGLCCYDAKSNKLQHKLIQIQYHECCLQAKIGYERVLVHENSYKFDNKYMFDIVFM